MYGRGLHWRSTRQHQALTQARDCAAFALLQSRNDTGIDGDTVFFAYGVGALVIPTIRFSENYRARHTGNAQAGARLGRAFQREFKLCAGIKRTNLFDTKAVNTGGGRYKRRK